MHKKMKTVMAKAQDLMSAMHDLHSSMGGPSGMPDEESAEGEVDDKGKGMMGTSVPNDKSSGLDKKKLIISMMKKKGY